ncbi:MAG TPA: Uma2 family endonuclease [Polyangiaceae bacterium]|nr:Uma2 family endonuclease [Polyangiaceae bacterium]
MGRRNTADEPEIPVVPPGEDELPCDDGEPMETARHRQQMVLLIQSLKAAWKRRRNYYVGGNMFVYFSETQVKKNTFRGPDVFVVLNTKDRDRRSWVAWQEGKLPDVVIELLSDRTRRIDRGEKMHIYAQLWRTSEYYLYDPWSHEFEGYRLDGLGQYQRIKPDAKGDLGCERLGLALGLRPGSFEGVSTTWLRWLRRSGAVLPSPEELAAGASSKARTAQKQAKTAQRIAAQERKRAEAAVRRVRALEKRLRG